MDALPAEIRGLIFAECVKVRAFALLYASKQIYHEFVPFLRERFVLAFHIEPSASSTVVTIINDDNSPWGNICTLDATSPHPDYGILDKMPVDHFARVRILMDAPDVSDPGQVVRGWLQSNGLVAALLPRWAAPDTLPVEEADVVIPKARSSKRIPPVTIQVRNTKSRPWCIGETWNRSNPDYDWWDPVTRTTTTEGTERKDDNGSSNSDVQVMLTPLSRIRYAESVAVQLPPGSPPLGRPVELLRDSLTTDCTRNKSFGLEVRWEVEWNDDDTLAFEDALHLWLDYLLDDMEGPTAALLRRDRFEHWCADYEFQIGRHFTGFNSQGDMIGNAEGCLQPELLVHIKKTFHDRFMSGREHVVAAYRDILRRHGRSVFKGPNQEHQLWYHSLTVEELGLDADLDLGEDAFWKTCYAHGIESKSRNDNWEDTSQIDLTHRLEPPEGGFDMTACQTFPLGIGRCRVCGQDWGCIRVVMDMRKAMRDYLFSYGGTPRVLLGPIVSKPIE